MGTVTAYNMASIQSALGGSNPISLSEYYRGGPYVPTTASSVVRTPASGDYYDIYSANYYYWNGPNPAYAGTGGIGWNGVFITSIASGVTSYTSGSTTYYRGSFRQIFYGCCSPDTWFWGVYTIGNVSVSINTSVPSSGTISISQLYGARNP
jgi:hypothetical protein